MIKRLLKLRRWAKVNKKWQVNVCEYAGNGWFNHFLPCRYPVARDMVEKGFGKVKTFRCRIGRHFELYCQHRVPRLFSLSLIECNQRINCTLLNQSWCSNFVMHTINTSITWKLQRTCSLKRTWKKNIINPWSELNIANRYLKIITSLLNAINPNNHVSPSNGSRTAVAFIAAFTLSSTSALLSLCEENIFIKTMTNTAIFT